MSFSEKLRKAAAERGIALPESKPKPAKPAYSAYAEKKVHFKPLCPGYWGGDIQLLAEVGETVYPSGAKSIRVVTLAHVNESGQVQLPGQGAFDGDWWEDDLDGESLNGGSEPKGVEIVTIVTDKRGETWVHGDTVKARAKRTVHAVGEDGRPLCGAKARGVQENGDRWDPWNDCHVSADTRVQTELPSFRVPTCQRCASKMETA
jgi:hypothetical protein